MINFIKCKRSYLSTPTLSDSLLLGSKGILRTTLPPRIFNVNITIEWSHSKQQNSYSLNIEYCGLQRIRGCLLLFFKYLKKHKFVFCKSQLISIWGWLFFRILKMLPRSIFRLFFIKSLTHKFYLAAVLVSIALFLMN